MIKIIHHFQIFIFSKKYLIIDIILEKYKNNIDEFENDIRKLSELNKERNIGTIKLMGEEPLLNSNIKDFTSIARNFFPNTRIELTTNWILLLKQQGDFLENYILVLLFPM